ncbi:MAG: hypothetical protein R2762_20985 [Bryobacteraceae bacterium]
MTLLLVSLLALAGSAQTPSAAPPTPEAKPARTEAGGDSAPAQQRTSLNLLGQTDTNRGESRRNENVQFNLVDNNAVKEMNIRLGATATIVGEFQADRRYFGAELGARPAAPVHAAASPAASVHGSLFLNHNNSIFSARSFFQVGDVRPARENNYGFTVNTSLWKGASLSMNGSQNKQRGVVNGNVLVPLLSERTPLTSDPQLRPIVENYLAAYPAELPNRTDIADRALNTNSPQQIDTDAAGIQLDQRMGTRDRITLRYGFTAQSVDAFQFVAGQNPDTDTKSHTARITWNRAWSAMTTMDASVGFDRLGSLLQPAAPYGSISSSNALSSIGPSPIIPIDRAQNRYRGAVSVAHLRGRHRLSFGGGWTRLQYNGEETDGHRGILSFRNDFGRDAITNLRMGTPSQLIQALGTTYRGFRNWDSAIFAGDRWQATSSLTLQFSLRYEAWTRPHDVTGRSNLQLDSDLNNFAPSFGFAQRMPGKWGVLRGAYGLHYGEIFPVTYGQDRLNAPNSLRIVINQPNLADPLGGRRFEELDPNGPSSLVEISRDLATPYSHQYNFSWEAEVAPQWKLQLGYAGSRSNKLIMTWFLNRGQVVEGIPLISATINERRANPNRYEHLYVLNGSRGYYDAGRASLVAPRWRGVNFSVSYWFSKAIDLGTDYANTASGPDARVAVSQTESDVYKDTKALSNFDQPHAFLGQFHYETPRGRDSVGRWLGGWELSGVVLAKPGTPFTVESGSDAPGFGNVDGARGDRPNLLDTAVLGRTIGHPDTAQSLLPRSAFAFIRPGEMAGSLGRNTFRKGRIANVNAALARTFVVSGDNKLTFRAESINFFNTAQFADPTKELASPSFGQINNTLNDGRTFRFGLRFEF